MTDEETTEATEEVEVSEEEVEVSEEVSAEVESEEVPSDEGSAESGEEAPAEAGPEPDVPAEEDDSEADPEFLASFIEPVEKELAPVNTSQMRHVRAVEQAARARSEAIRKRKR